MRRMLTKNLHRIEYNQLKIKLGKVEMQQQSQQLPDKREVLELYSLAII